LIWYLPAGANVPEFDGAIVRAGDEPIVVDIDGVDDGLVALERVDGFEGGEVPGLDCRVGGTAKQIRVVLRLCQGPHGPLVHGIESALGGFDGNVRVLLGKGHGDDDGFTARWPRGGGDHIRRHAHPRSHRRRQQPQLFQRCIQIGCNNTNKFTDKKSKRTGWRGLIDSLVDSLIHWLIH